MRRKEEKGERRVLARKKIGLFFSFFLLPSSFFLLPFAFCLPSSSFSCRYSMMSSEDDLVFVIGGLGYALDSSNHNM